MENKIKLLLEKVVKDYMKAIIRLKARVRKTKGRFIASDAIDNAYEFAHYNEIKSFFTDYDADEFFENDMDLLDKALTTNKNIIQHIWNCWLNYNHPERYNFFFYENLWDIIKDALRTL